MESRWRGSNPRLPGPKPGALPTALHLEMKTTKQTKRTVDRVVQHVLRLCLSLSYISLFLGSACLDSFQAIFPLFCQGFRCLQSLFAVFPHLAVDSQAPQPASSSSGGDSGFPVKFILSDFTRERCACNNALLCSFVFGSPPDIPDTLKCLSEKKEK